MSTDVDFLIIGGGAMGSAAAFSLASRGHQVLLLERFAPGHHEGASHGATRNFNPAYADPAYVGLLRRADQLWEDISLAGGVQLLNRTGLVNHGDEAGQQAIHAALTAAGIDSELLDADEAGARFAGMRFETQALHIPSGGQLNADLAVATLQRLAAAAGAEIRHGHRVLQLEVVSEDMAKIVVDDGERAATVSARRVILAAGAWTRTLLGERWTLPRIHVTEEHPVHFAQRGTSAQWPGFNHTLPPGEHGGLRIFAPVYGMRTPGEGIKVGWHGSGRVVDPEHRPHQLVADQLCALQAYARRWLPGTDPDSFEPVSCTYANTEDEHFILDRLGPVTIGAGFSGHGFKFVPAIGEHLAQLASGEAGVIPRFAADRAISNPVFLERRMRAGLSRG
ncbi:FAD-dependent oxidoreductase [Glutamicibacter protophormiae]|uniref:Sarcosine oxidase n=1 Tax=Glutamicibacter protophormiae TaxID=37930 RepID=A0ABS4XLS2_GLUPR|nr:FAD-dependent oxidoreductase [Glutamicibacter protophormiae]MBP2397461.1 sarcosine oxidase [Glutamicibacter protophormiae]GGL79060.1 N-methyltryptophan oxidase [Glutamicibacter protophormiae]